MSYPIDTFPDVDPGKFLRGGRREDPLLGRKNVFLYSSGRAALYQAVRAAGLPPRSRLLAPSFHCGVEVEAVKRAGHPVSFYHITRSLEIDFEDLERRVDRGTSALMVIHYFGFPQDVRRISDFCKNHDLLLFEDCAHALYSKIGDGWLGASGDFGIYSLRKTMGLPDGGALLCNNQEFAAPDKGHKYWDFRPLKRTVKSMLTAAAGDKSLLGSMVRGIWSSVSKGRTGPGKSVPASSEPSLPWYYDVRSRDYDNVISGLSRFLLRKEDHRAIIGKRREHYLRIGRGLENSPYPLKSDPGLAGGVCPLCFVVRTPRRDAWAARLRRRGINPFVFGVSPHPLLTARDFPELEFLSKELLGLPVHQDLSPDDIDILLEEFRKGDGLSGNAA